MTNAEAALADFTAGFDPADVHGATLERIRLHILDALACGLAGVAAEHRAEMKSVADGAFGPGSATVIGGTSRAAAGAVLLNGFQIAAPTLGDVHRATLTHVMPEVLPAALAAAERHGATGADFLAGVGAGMEVTVRVAQALDSDEYRARGWHNPGIAGTVGAACAAARVAGLDTGAVRVAIGHAASQAAGTFAALGTDGVKVHQARGGLSGFLAAELAAAGIDASSEALTAERGGLLAAYAGGGVPERLTDGLGSEWRLMEVALRRWPGASSLQPVIAAVLTLREGTEDIEQVLVELPPRAFALNGTSGWETRLSALQSARWTVAVALVDGAIWLDQTDDERRADAAVAQFASERVVAQADPSLLPTGARVTVTDGAGVRREEQVDVPPGDPARPLSVDDVRLKLERAASSIGLGDRVDRIAAAVDGLESAPSLDALTSALREDEEQ